MEIKIDTPRRINTATMMEAMSFQCRIVHQQCKKGLKSHSSFKSYYMSNERLAETYV